MCRTITLTNLLSNVENLPKIGPTAVIVRRGWVRHWDGRSTWGDGGHWGLPVFGENSVTELVFLGGPRVPVDLASGHRTQGSCFPGGDCHALLQGIFPTQRIEPRSPALPCCA